MNNHYFDFQTVGKFSSNDIAYSSGNHRLKDFYQFTPAIENLNEAVEKRKEFPVDRDLLVQVFRQQYQRFCKDETVFDRIERLKSPDTFTITTAHQPTLLTGPLYFIYKCLSAIKVTQEFNRSQDKYHTQAILVLGGED